MRRALGIVLTRVRIAEIDQDAVAHIAGDEARETPYDLGHRVVIGANQVPQILGIAPYRQCGRADEVAEHDGELSALAARCARNRIGGGVAQCRDRGEQFAPVPDEVDPDVPEVVGGQLGQYGRVDRVVAKRLIVLLQSEAVEPACNVHACSPMRSSRRG